MIQELLGGSNVGIIGGGILDASPSPSPSPSSSAALTTTTPAPRPPPPATPENLRCPRCDSANTKFCYYNNYNLTQPRHFCKTCRRYWTKGGALRNVPIGGGCRKNKSTTVTAAAVKPSAAGKLKTISQEIGKSCLFSGFEQTELTPNPLFWTSTQNSHLLSLLRANQNPNLSHLQDHMSAKEEGLMFGSSHLSSESSISSTGGLNSRVSGLDTLGQLQVPSIGLSNPFYRNQGILLGEVQSNGLQELYQRLRTSTSYPEHAPVIQGNVASGTSASTSAVLESAPVAAGEFGFWNPTFSWPADLSTTSGAYP